VKLPNLGVGLFDDELCLHMPKGDEIQHQAFPEIGSLNPEVYLAAHKHYVTSYLHTHLVATIQPMSGYESVLMCMCASLEWPDCDY
jgi:hypothetical protein